jgi:tetratricopeptide (TPR) repeat protein
VADRTSPPIQLTILRQGDLNVVDLAELGSLIPRSETHVDDAFLRELADETAHLAGEAHAGGTAAVRALERVGGLIFSHLLTEPARARLRDAPPGDLYLRLDEQLVHVPWELCHDGRDFLATKFRIGRQVITSQRIPERPPTRTPGSRLRVLVVVDPTDSLPQASAEAEQLCALLDDVPAVEVTLLGGRSVRRIPLLTALQEHDVVHFAGHSHYEPGDPSRSGWRLAEGVLTAGELSKLRPPPALVFSNSCQAGTTAAWDGGYGYEGRAFGIGSAFLLAGVPNYVGTFWVIHDDESVLFATTCYRALATGESIGAALLQARHAVIEQRGLQSLTWASYLLYGDPAFTPLPSVTGVTSAPVAPSVAAPPKYRFAVEVSAQRGDVAATSVDAGGVSPAAMVGRGPELADLEHALAQARSGARAVVFACGPAGIGKTTLVDALIDRCRASGDVRVGRGQSVEQYGAGEPYLPVLEAWSRLAREPGGPELVAALRVHAPTWLAQLPGLLDAGESEALQRRTMGATRERMLREMAELLEAVTATQPLLLVLEDLHWSDHSTLELIAYVAQRRTPARLLVVGTYRPTEALASDHPLRATTQELQARRCATELRLESLARPAVGEYLRGRLAGGTVDDELVALIHGRTDGHPLFLVNVVDFALRQGLIAEEARTWGLRGGRSALESGVPDGLRQMIERQVESLAADERQVLEAASVVGVEFAVAAIAAALQEPDESLEERCEGLAWKGQFLHDAGVEEWPDGTVSGRYRFVHALYRDVLYERVAEARRVRLHRRIAERKVAAFGPRAGEIAAELAAHFEAARDLRQAVSYATRAGDTAIARHADREAIEHFSKALRQLATLPETTERLQCELDLQVRLATPLMSTHGYAAPELERVFQRAHALSRQTAGGPHLFPLLRGLVSFYQVRAQHEMAFAVGEELLSLCEDGGDALAIVQAHYGHGVTLYDQGDLAGARRHLERGLARYDPETHALHAYLYGGYDPGVGCRTWLSWVQWLQGHAAQSLASVEDAVALADRLGHPFSRDFAHLCAATVRLYRGEASHALQHVALAAEISSQEGFAYQRATAAVLEGWAFVIQGRPDDALRRLRDGLDGYAATGAAVARPGVMALLAYATAMTGHPDDALAHVADGLDDAQRTGQRLHLVQLHLTRGDILAWGGASGEESWTQALATARALHAPMLAVRPATRLAQRWVQDDRHDEARALLGPVLEVLADEDVPDVREARSVLASIP